MVERAPETDTELQDDEEAPSRAWLPPLPKLPGLVRKRVVSAPGISAEEARLPEGRRVKFSPLLASFIGVVVLPSLAVVLYFAHFASDQFSTETRFAVRSVEGEVSQTSPTGQSNASTSAGVAFSGGSQSAYIVSSYIHSRAIVDDLSAKLNLREIFKRPQADFWARLKHNASMDELTDYWNSMVTTYVDQLSGIVTVKLRAFRRDDVLALGQAVIEASERLVNRISDRARRDSTEMAEKDVRRSSAAVQAALSELHEFRDKAGIIDPSQASNELGKLVVPLMNEKIKLESDLFVASREMTDEAPTIRLMKSRIETVEQQIAELKAQLTDAAGGDRTISSALTKFEQLEIQREFAEKLYSLAQAGLERAQMRAARQGVYLSVFVPPSLPQEARYPRRVYFSVLIFLGLGIIWAIGAMVTASIEDHRL